MRPTASETVGHAFMPLCQVLSSSFLGGVGFVCAKTFSYWQLISVRQTEPAGNDLVEKCAFFSGETAPETP